MVANSYNICTIMLANSYNICTLMLANILHFKV